MADEHRIKHLDTNIEAQPVTSTLACSCNKSWLAAGAGCLVDVIESYADHVAEEKSKARKAMCDCCLFLNRMTPLDNNGDCPYCKYNYCNRDVHSGAYELCHGCGFTLALCKCE